MDSQRSALILKTTKKEDRLLEDITYDEGFKRFFAYKALLAITLKALVPEYKDSTIEDIRDKYIQGDIESSRDQDKIVSAGAGVEDGNVKYDIKFDALLPESTKDHMRVIINIEGQKSTSSLGYDLATRGIYYACNMISSEYGTIFSRSEYEKLEKVYSIWISMSPTNKEKGSIVRYKIVEENPTNDYRNKKENYDKLEVIILNLGEIDEEANINYNEKKVSRYLTKVFTETTDAEEAIEELRSEFGIDLPESVKEDLKNMCNLSEALIARSTEAGREAGRQEDALRMIAGGKLTYEEIASYTDLPLETVKELAAKKTA